MNTQIVAKVRLAPLTRLVVLVVRRVVPIPLARLLPQFKRLFPVRLPLMASGPVLLP